MKNAVSSGIILALVVVGAWLVWQWGFCRFYVGPNQMAVITAKVGAALPPGQLLARDGQKGIREAVLAEGRHFLNPVSYEHEIVPAILIPAGKVGVVTAKVGGDLPEGDFLAEPGQKGIWRQLLGPGKYRLNPYGYKVEIVDAISIPIGYVGVMTSLSGEQAPEGAFAGPRQKGVRADVLQPGLYYINPREFKVDVLEIGLNQVSLLGKQGSAVITKSKIASQNAPMAQLQEAVLTEQAESRADYVSQSRSFGGSYAPAAARERAMDAKKAGKPVVGNQAEAPIFVLNQFVEFPSRDGFLISLDMTVEFEMTPASVAGVFRTYGDLPAAVDKVIMPQILSISRLKGSAYGARDFIVGEGREKFQQDLTETLARELSQRKIIIHNALIRHVDVPMQILEPIQQASVATEQDLTNQEKWNTAKKQAELNTELSLIEQRREQVQQETSKIQAETRADQDRQVAQTRAETVKLVAEIDQQSAGVRAQKTATLGLAQADVVRMVEGEKASGYRMKIAAFGDAAAYNLWNFAGNLSTNLRVNVLHAGLGTLWTDLEKARLGDLNAAKALEAK